MSIRPFALAKVIYVWNVSRKRWEDALSEEKNYGNDLDVLIIQNLVSVLVHLLRGAAKASGALQDKYLTMEFIDKLLL